VPRGSSASVVAIILMLAGTIAVSGPAEAGLIGYFIVQYPSISPNGDGIKDSSAVHVELIDACTQLLMTVDDPSNGAPLDTLILRLNAAPGVYSAEWKGRDSSGGLLPEGSYALHVAASAGSTTENLTRTAIVDTTAPRVAIDRIDPGIYTPNVPGSADKVLIYFTISRYGEGDTLSLLVTRPDSTVQRMPVAASGDGTHSLEWSALSTAADGIYRLVLLIADEAGNSGADSASVDVDTAGPILSFIDAPPSYTNVVPLVLLGTCYDRNGVRDDSLFWDGGPALLPDSTFMAGDTLVWRFDAADSLKEGNGYREGSHSLKIKCSDVFGHESEKTLLFVLDLTPPPVPRVNAIAAIVHKAEISISGTVDKANTKFVYVYQSAGGQTRVKRKETLTAGFSVQDTLRLGENAIWARAEDEAGNVSDSSSVQTVTYEIAAGITHPEVFRRPDAFHIFTERSVRGIKIEIFTVAGELVATLSQRGPGTEFELPWNLTNDDGENVRNGPYLAVVTVTYDNGPTVEKRLFAVVR
jgi:flagellar hook assembly protein FlgD